MISTILLAAGLSQRFGSPKPLVVLNNKTIIELHQQKLLDSGANEIIVVLGSSREAIEPYVFNHKRIKVVYNKDYKLGQTSSFKCGLGALSSECNGIMLLPVDYPFIQEVTFENLIKHFNENHPLILIPTFHNAKGHPPIYDISLKNDFEKLSDHEGLNAIARRYQKEVRFFTTEDEGVVQSFNTKEEFEKLVKG
ncbi:MAG: nucleotidyltransferase family protein [Candidatus Omnitrophica bacterium]|nr:nucleotidyltransferase family protein [Candidatus Omnitrophota bacterium]